MKHNKSELNKEILEKVKPGVKPSDLKKKQTQFTHGLATPPDSPVLKPSPGDILPPPPPPFPNKELQETKKALKVQNQIVVDQQRKLEKARERIKELEEKNSEQSEQKEWEYKKTIRELQEKNTTLIKTMEGMKNKQENKENVLERNQPEKTFLCSDCQQNKPTTELSRQFKEFSFCRDCSVEARTKAKEQKETKPTQFICHSCNNSHEGTPNKMKLDQTLQEYNICQECRPILKEFNEADLITDELWEKYPYSSASEILEKEFGIRRENK